MFCALMTCTVGCLFSWVVNFVVLSGVWVLYKNYFAKTYWMLPCTCMHINLNIV